ncbi:ImcF-related family protein [Gilliamella mensalis]|uniref:ImcF-related family protein n=1 Tax=Gilliamella mensalis TaxID=1908520 RepID=UPI000A15FF9B|nr:ImcF-related family protein [Gilliamella mensalis]
MNKWKWAGLIFIILLGAILLALGLFFWGDWLNYTSKGEKVQIWLQGMLLLFCLLLTPILVTNSYRLWAKDKTKRESLNPIQNEKPKEPPPFAEFLDIKKQCRYRLGFFWRYKVCKCLVLGHHSDIELLLPNLPKDQWQLSDNTLMVYGGDIQDEPNALWLQALKRNFSRILPFFSKPLNAVIWVAPKHYLDDNRHQQLLIEKAVLKLQARNKILKWSAPLYLVAGQRCEWSQTERIEQSIGVLFNGLKQDAMDAVVISLNQLAKECSQRGVRQIKDNPHYSFLLKLSQNLVKRDITHIKRYLTSLVAFPYSPYVRGLFFVPDQSKPNSENMPIFDHSLAMTPTWQSISDDANSQFGRRMGIQWGIWSCYALLAFMGVMCVALCTSYFRNASLIDESVELVKQADDSVKQDYFSRLQIQHQLQQHLEQLLYRQQQGAPLLYRFGLNHNDEVLKRMWLTYRATNSRNIATPFYNIMTDYLTLLTELPPDDPKRIKLVDSAYDVLKVYLMLGQPDKSDGIYLSQFASKQWRTPEGMSDGDWQRLMPDLVRFWGQMLNLHPDWAQHNDARLIKNIRQMLINKIGVQNAVNTLYQEMIQRASQHYANQNLNQLLEGLDSKMLFFTDAEIPGVYTRKAWDDTIEDEIADAAKYRKEQIDWVLSDGESDLTASISPDALKKQLTDRYFSEYSAAWLYFLNTIQWHSYNNVSDVIEQLTLLADTRQSPLIALINVVKYQSNVAFTGNGFSDNLIRSAKKMVDNKSKIALPTNNEATGPLTATFLPITSLLDNDNTNGLSLQTYLSRITQVRLKLQNIANSADPQAMMQELAKSVFKGTSVDLTETRDYGNLIAANLGEEWSGFGYSLFKQPLEQSWQVVLAPAANSFNDVWQNYIVNQWEKSFAGRYPFKNSDNEASLAELARFLRADTGIVDNFITSELNGVLEKKGGRWVVNSVNAQGLNFAPQFLNALNLFNELSAELLATGDVSVSFDLMPRSGGKIVRTELLINKQKMEYFNQSPTWQRFNWPGDGYSPYSQLSWSSDTSGLRLYQYYSGDWAWIRLLESASVKPLDSSRYELIWKAPDERKLRFILRTQLGRGPLTLLKLRNFTLPKKVFE